MCCTRPAAWKGRLDSCSLGSLERSILAHQRNEDDVPGSMIPLLYQQYLQTGDARSMAQVFYHNLEDIVSMTYLAERVCRHFDDVFDEIDDDLHGHDLLALGQVHEQMGHGDVAERALRQALATRRCGAGRGVRVLGADAQTSGSLGRSHRTVAGVDHVDPRPRRASLTKNWPNTTNGKPAISIRLSCGQGWALHNQQKAPAYQRSRQAIDALTHRLDRLQAKLAGKPVDHAAETE
ncbi:MAG: ribonuclease H-like domain-containing protein [Caldilineaceae bacterium]